MYLGNIDIFNPYGPQIKDRSILKTLQHTEKLYSPFLQLLGSRWLVAAENDPENKTQTICGLKDAVAPLVITHDWFVSDMKRYDEDHGAIGTFAGKIFVFSDLPSEFLEPPFYSAFMNGFISNPDIDINHAERLPYIHYKNANHTFPIVKMGCADTWLPQVDHMDKTIFLDEPHPSVIDSLKSGVGLRGRMYLHALEVCKILSHSGFRIVTFVREKNDFLEDLWAHHAFLEKRSVGSWIPFAKLIDYYAEASLFFSFTHETYGFPCYENLQLGNAIICYSETHDPYAFRQFENAAMLSVRMDVNLSASLVEDFYSVYKTNSLRRKIRFQAKQDYACENFMFRLRQALGAYI